MSEKENGSPEQQEQPTPSNDDLVADAKATGGGLSRLVAERKAPDPD